MVSPACLQNPCQTRQLFRNSPELLGWSPYHWGLVPPPMRAFFAYSMHWLQPLGIIQESPRICCISGDPLRKSCTPLSAIVSNRYWTREHTYCVYVCLTGRHNVLYKKRGVSTYYNLLGSTFFIYSFLFLCIYILRMLLCSVLYPPQFYSSYSFPVPMYIHIRTELTASSLPAYTYTLWIVPVVLIRTRQVHNIALWLWVGDSTCIYIDRILLVCTHVLYIHR